MMALLSLSRTDCEEKPEETLERTVKSCYRLFQMEKDRQKNCKSEKKSALKAESTPFYKLILNVTTQRYEYQVQGAH